jgi:uracil phosphoribosyltransferase
MLVYEATRGLPTIDVTTMTPLGPATGRRLAEDPVIVPVLRAGVGFL